MKIAIPSTGQDIDGAISPTFARAPYFVIVDSQSLEARAIKNPYVVGRGVGYATAELIANEGAEAVITNTIGPNAASALRGLGIKIYQASGSIREAVQALKNNRISELTTPMRGPGLGLGRGQGRGAGFGQGRGLGIGRRFGGRGGRWTN